MKMSIEKKCPFCCTLTSIEVNLTKYEKWQNGESIQKAMPELSATERETLISGLCPKCIAKFFD